MPPSKGARQTRRPLAKRRIPDGLVGVTELHADRPRTAGIPVQVIDELMGHAGGRGGAGELEQRGSLVGLRYRWTTPEMQARVVAAIEQRSAVALEVVGAATQVQEGPSSMP